MCGLLCFSEQIIGDDGFVTYQNLIDAWELKDAKARIIFYCNVEIGWQVRIEGCSWVVDMWKIDCFYSLQRLPQPNPFFLWLNFTIISTTKVPQTNVTHS
jgi:hypothetical protein